MSNPMKIVLERQPAKKRPNVFNFEILDIFRAKVVFLKKCATKIIFSKPIGLLLVKNHLHIQFVESTWLKHFVMHLCPKVVFPFLKNIFIIGFT
jgi:hypothetical protein